MSFKVVTFYSWKGGVGRTMALANAAVQLARAGLNVLMVDWDLEAPGLDRYFLPGKRTGSSAPSDYHGSVSRWFA
jgi:MinD-like ATPase involved in chromosome partitioning or flagellar assembly